MLIVSLEKAYDLVSLRNKALAKKWTKGLENQWHENMLSTISIYFSCLREAANSAAMPAVTEVDVK